MTDTSSSGRLDAVTLEVLRSRLQAIAEEGAITIERTAISPVIAESRDYSCTLLEANGDLIVAGGAITHHFGVCGHAVRATMDKFGTTIAPGDMFFANDPHNGGGLHAQDVLVQLPVYVGDQLIAWVVNSGHMLDMGGLTFGSWSPEAVDCYQEALRLPPVRLFQAGEEQRDVWDIIRNNVRVPDIVEMDLRSLVAGCDVAGGKLVGLSQAMGQAQFLRGLTRLKELAEQEMRRRITALTDGLYRYTTWTEWHGELFRVPCALTVSGDCLEFDFTGAPPQTTHFFNSKPHIIEAQIVGDGSDVLAFDLPLTQGMFAPVTVTVPPNSIVSSLPPAPVASAHIDVALNASMAAQQCIMLAMAASEPFEATHLLCGPVAPTAMALSNWSYTTSSGLPDGWMLLDGSLSGSSAGYERDGTDLFTFMVARKPIIEAIDVEMLEWWYPVLTDFKKVRAGAFGAGRYRGGAGCHMQFRPHGTDQLVGSLIAVREQLPLSGTAGGQPGATSEFTMHYAEAGDTPIPGKASGVIIGERDALEFRLGSGGGHGDPVERDPGEVAREVRQGRLSVQQAADVYGVVVEEGRADPAATGHRRAELLAARLAAAAPPRRPAPERAAPAPDGAAADGPDLPLYPGVVQRGRRAYAAASGACLAQAPDPWTDGCPTMERGVTASLTERSYLDPRTGQALLVEVVPNGHGCTITTSPARWSQPDAVIR
jgi:N-methylhydantoinase B